MDALCTPRQLKYWMKPPSLNQRFMNEFFLILEHFCPLFIQIAQIGLILPRWGLTLPRISPPTQQSQIPFRDMYLHKTAPIPSQNTPFPGLNLKVGVGKMDPTWEKCLKSGQKFSKSGPKNYSSKVRVKTYTKAVAKFKQLPLWNIRL